MRSLQALSKSSKKSLKVLGGGPKDSGSGASDQQSAVSLSDFDTIITAPPNGGSGMRRQDCVQRDADIHSVRILADRFQPPYVRVKLGDKVCWSLEMDSRPSNVKAMHVVSFVQLDEESDLMKTKED